MNKNRNKSHTDSYRRSLPFREHFLDALLLGGQRDVCALAAEQLVFWSVHAHHGWRL